MLTRADSAQFCPLKLLLIQWSCGRGNKNKTMCWKTLKYSDNLKLLNPELPHKEADAWLCFREDFAIWPHAGSHLSSHHQNPPFYTVEQVATGFFSPALTSQWQMWALSHQAQKSPNRHCCWLSTGQRHGKRSRCQIPTTEINFFFFSLLLNKVQSGFYFSLSQQS